MVFHFKILFSILADLYAFVLMVSTRPLISNPPFPLSIYTNPSARVGYDTKLIFKRSLSGFNSEFSFS